MVWLCDIDGLQDSYCGLTSLYVQFPFHSECLSPVVLVVVSGR